MPARRASQPFGPRIRVPPPGPKSKKAIARRERFVTRGLRPALPIDVVRAEGALVEDADGNVYVDLGVGIGVHNAGHRPASVIRAAKEQLDRLTHISYMVAAYEPYTALAERMAAIAPRGLTKSIFLNSGSEAVENAIKIARAHTRRPWIVSFKSAFHGRTLLDISLTAKERPYRHGFGPFVEQVIHADYPYPYRDPVERSPAESAKAHVDAIADAITRPAVQGKVGALLAEPVQGEAGMVVPPPQFFALLRRLCDKHGVLLIDDEVQAGMGRAGPTWAIENWKTVPDLLVSGKAVAGGLPYGGVTGRPDVMDAPEPGSLGGTFGGNPVVCAAALEAIEEVEAARRHVPKTEAVLRRRLGEMAARYEAIGEARGIGAMWALEFVKHRRTKEPDGELPRRVQLEGLKRGLILITAGYHNNCVRLLPPLNIEPGLLETALDTLDAAIGAATRP